MVTQHYYDKNGIIENQIDLVTKAPRFSRSVPILKRLHWLPVKFRIHFKICAITFRTLKDNQPAYLANLLVRPKCSKYLRSTNSNIFVVPRRKTKTGSRAFSCPAVVPRKYGAHSIDCAMNYCVIV